MKKYLNKNVVIRIDNNLWFEGKVIQIMGRTFKIKCTTEYGKSYIVTLTKKDFKDCIYLNELDFKYC